MAGITRQKHIAQRIHAKKRAKERYGVDFTTSDLKNLIDKIQNRKALLIEKQSLRLSVFKVDIYYVVYDKKRKEIVTFLTEEMANNNNFDA